MKKMLIFEFEIILALLLITFLSYPISDLGRGRDFSGYEKLRLEREVYNIKNPVPVQFFYGHDYYDSIDTSLILGHTVDVYISNGGGGFTQPQEYVILYEKVFESTDFIADEYQCDAGMFIFSPVRFFNHHDLNIDFSQIEYTRGMLVVRISERVMTQDNIDGEIIEGEITLYSSAYLFFKIVNQKVIFSNRQIY